MTRTRLFDRIVERPDRNVGSSDFLTRVAATIVMVGAIALVAPPMGMAYPLIKIGLLIAAELGLVSLMLGLFLNAKTYFAGLQLFATSLAMFYLTRWGQPWIAVGLGTLITSIGIANLATRRSRLNQVLNLSSLREVIADVAPSATKPSAADELGARP